MANDVKQCPFCAEDIKAAAIVCKHCKRDLPVGSVEVQPLTEVQRMAADLPVKSRSNTQPSEVQRMAADLPVKSRSNTQPSEVQRMAADLPVGSVQVKPLTEAQRMATELPAKGKREKKKRGCMWWAMMSVLGIIGLSLCGIISTVLNTTSNNQVAPQYRATEVFIQTRVAKTAAAKISQATVSANETATISAETLGEDGNNTNTPSPATTSTLAPTKTSRSLPATYTPGPTKTSRSVTARSNTSTPVPTGTFTPTNTFTPIPANTNTSVPTSTFTPIPEPTETPEPSTSTIPEGVSYTLINEDVLLDTKRSLEIRISERVSEDVLRAIAIELKNSDSKTYGRTFIGYYLPKMTVDAGAWATTHFDPDLDVKILGLTSEEAQSLLETPNDPSKTIFGSWLDDRPYSGKKITIYYDTGDFYIEEMYTDESTNIAVLVEEATNDGRKFIDPECCGYGEYYLIDGQGDLQLWDNDGHFGTASSVSTVAPVLSTASASTPAPTSTFTPLPTSTYTPIPPPAFTPTPTSTFTPVPNQFAAISGANLRSGPSTAYDVIGGVGAGQVLSVSGKNADSTWLQLNTGEWISASLVSGQLQSLPVVAAPAPPTLVPAVAVPPTSPPVQAVQPNNSASLVQPAATPIWSRTIRGTTFTSDCPCSQGNVLNCSDFPRGREIDAQACYERCKELTNGADVHGLDRDKDGDACEWSW